MAIGLTSAGRSSGGMARTQNSGTVSSDGITGDAFGGVLSRGCGAQTDMRSITPYEAYGYMGFESCCGFTGCAFARCELRSQEIFAAAIILMVQDDIGPEKILLDIEIESIAFVLFSIVIDSNATNTNHVFGECPKGVGCVSLIMGPEIIMMHIQLPDLVSLSCCIFFAEGKFLSDLVL